jgi:hypothetical protein
LLIKYNQIALSTKNTNVQPIAGKTICSL